MPWGQCCTASIHAVLNYHNKQVSWGVLAENLKFNTYILANSCRGKNVNSGGIFF